MEPNAPLSQKRAMWSLMSKIRGDHLGAVLTPQICFPSNHCGSDSPEKFSLTRKMCITAFRYLEICSPLS